MSIIFFDNINSGLVEAFFLWDYYKYSEYCIRVVLGKLTPLYFEYVSLKFLEESFYLITIDLDYNNLNILYNHIIINKLLFYPESLLINIFLGGK